MAMIPEDAVAKYYHERHKGRVHKMQTMRSPEFTGLCVLVEFRIPEGEGDELEMFRRIHKVVDVIAGGVNDEGA